MRLHLPCTWLVVILASGCFDSKLDPGAPAPNYNPAAERDDDPESKESESRPRSAEPNDTGAAAGDNRRAHPQGSARIIKDFQGLTPEKIQKVFEENEARQRGDFQETSEADDSGPREAPE